MGYGTRPHDWELDELESMKIDSRNRYSTALHPFGVCCTPRRVRQSVSVLLSVLNRPHFISRQQSIRQLGTEEGGGDDDGFL